MTADTNMLIGIIIGACLACLCFLFFRDFILARFTECIQIKATPMAHGDESLLDAVRHDIKVDYLLLKDNKKIVETILGLQVELNDADVKSLNSLLVTINKRIEYIQASDLVKEDNLEQEEE